MVSCFTIDAKSQTEFTMQSCAFSVAGVAHHELERRRVFGPTAPQPFQEGVTKSQGWQL